jgi:hypothetical protein
MAFDREIRMSMKEEIASAQKVLSHLQSVRFLNRPLKFVSSRMAILKPGNVLFRGGEGGGFAAL